MRNGIGLVGSGSSAKGSPAGPGGAWDATFLSGSRMGKSNNELVQKLINGIDELIKIEMGIEKGGKIQDVLGKNSNILEL